jgi:hypothetical protein
MHEGETSYHDFDGEGTDAKAPMFPAAYFIPSSHILHLGRTPESGQL